MAKIRKDWRGSALYIANMNMDEFSKCLKRLDTAVIPVGMTEAHGHHCPLGTDVLIPRHILKLIDDRIGHRIMIAPEVPYGHSWTLGIYPGTIDIPAEVFGEYVYHVGKGLAKWGVRKIVLFNGHGGNIATLSLVMERLADIGLAVILVNWWRDYAEEIRSICEGQGHAGEDETSAVLAIDPKLVDMSRARTNWQRAIGDMRYPAMGKDTMTHAMTGDATRASSDKGHTIYRRIVPRIIELIDKFQAGEWIV